MAGIVDKRPSVSDTSKLLAVARGEEKADLVFKNARLADLAGQRLLEADLAVADGRIAGIGSYSGYREEDLRGAVVCPAFIDGHVHLESSMVSLPDYARAVVPRGTLGVVTDLHEIANVLGMDGIKYMIEVSRGLPLELYVMAPSCVPATPMETAGAVLGVKELVGLRDDGLVMGLGEVMNYPGVIAGDPEVMAKLQAFRGLPVDGHAPGLSGAGLNAYVAAGIQSDHECVTAAEAMEKLSRGMYVYVREGSTAKNLESLLPAVLSGSPERFLLVSDDVNPEDLSQKGHLDYLVRRAVELGLDPLRALRMVTVNPARRFGIADTGELAPGYRANLVVLEDLKGFRVLQVYREGEKVAQEGENLWKAEDRISGSPASMRIAWGKIPGIALRAEGKRIRVIGVVPDQIVTESLVEEAKVEDGNAVQDPSRDILKICVFERHRGTGNVGVGFVRGFGLREGALASTVAHDSHNLVVVGSSDEEIWWAAQVVEKMGGGQVVVRGEEVLADLPLQVAGLMSTLPLEQVRERVQKIRGAARQLGCRLSDPMMALAFMALPVIPSLKITDRGLFDVDSFRHVPVFLD
ncbi:MAG: adenine deaminase [Candidatus Geothermincolales bacterium]